MIKFHLIIVFSFFLLVNKDSLSQENTNIPPELQKQLTEYQDLLTKYQLEDNNNQEAAYLNKIAFIYWELENYQRAIEFFSKSLNINSEIGNKNGIFRIYTNLGMIYSDARQYQISVDNLQRALSMAQDINNKQDIASALVNLSLVLQTIDLNSDAIEYLEKALALAIEINNLKLLRTIYGMLSENYEKIGNAEKSFDYFNLYSSFEKHLQKEEIKIKEKETQQQLNKMQNITDNAVKDKKKKEEELRETTASLEKVEEINKQKQLEIELKELKLKDNENEIKNRNYQIRGAIIAIVLMLIIALITFRNYKQKKVANLLLEKQNQEIKEKNKNISRSINYAQRIQEAMMPEMEGLQEYLEESFILFKPRDVVSGDFFWFIDPYKVLSNIDITSNDDKVTTSFISKLKDNNFIIAAVDCTGHGIPGAFMSMIGMNMLYQIVSNGVVEADKILNELHLGIRTALKQDVSENQDGMDMTLCVIKKKEKIVEFAGAKNPLIYIQNGELKRIRGNKISVGGPQYELNRKFTKHTIKIDTPTTFYIYSDGYIDQFGGLKETKYLSRNLNNLLLDISKEDFSKQKEILNRTIDSWKGDIKQTDDILVIGFKIS